ncbi:MAG TPA: hypothetical protein PKA46_13430, partial [Ferruginibacter sp.]|nr:hypothetical protein [Ferruginibacter sp.]
MKLIQWLLIVVLCFAAIMPLAAQDTVYVHWKAESKKKASTGEYTVYLKGIITKGWHVYARGNAAEGLDGLTVSAENTTAVMEGAVSITGNEKTINDKIFDGAAQQVITDSIAVQFTLRFSETVPQTAKLQLSYNTASDAFIPEEQVVTVPFEDGVALATAFRMLIPSINLKAPVNDCGGRRPFRKPARGSGFFSFFF